jgi:hypothetical protein
MMRSFVLAIIVMILLGLWFGIALDFMQRPVSSAFSTEGVGPDPDGTALRRP